MNFPGGWELVLVVLVIVLLFGARKLPEAARGLGRSLRIFKAEVKDPNDVEGRDALDEPTPPATAQQPAIMATPVAPATPVVPVQPVQQPVQQVPPNGQVPLQQPVHQPVQPGQQSTTER